MPLWQAYTLKLKPLWLKPNSAAITAYEQKKGGPKATFSVGRRLQAG